MFIRTILILICIYIFCRCRICTTNARLSAQESGDEVAAKSLSEELAALQQDIEVASSAAYSLRNIAASVEPSQLAKLFGGIHEGLMGCLSAAIYEGAAKVSCASPRITTSPGAC